MATTQERIARVLLQFGVDRKSLTQTNQQMAAFNKTLNDLERQNALDKLARDGARAVRETGNLRSATGRLRAELVKIGATDKEIKRVVTQFDRMAQSALRARDAAAQATRSTRGNTGLRAIGTDIRNLPAVPIPGTGISTDVVGKILASIGRTQVTFDQLAIGLGIAGTAGVALIAVIGEFSASLQQTRERIHAEITARQKLNEILVTGTTRVITAELERLKIQQKIAELNLADIAPDFAARFKELADQNLLGFDAFAKVIGLNDPVFAQLQEDALAAFKALQDVNRDIAIYEEALGSSGVAANDTAIAEEELRKKRQATTDLILQTQLQAQIAVQNMTAESIRERLKGLEFEQQATEKLQKSGLLSVDVFEELTNRLFAISTEMIVFEGALPKAEQLEVMRAIDERLEKRLALELSIAATTADQGIERLESLQREEEAILALVASGKASPELIQKLGERFGELRMEANLLAEALPAKLAAEAAVAFAQLQEKIGDITEHLQEQLAEAEQNRVSAIGEARRDAAIAESEAVREAGLERAEIERQSQLRVQQIIRRARFDEANAIQDRDAVALDAVRRRKREELQTEEENRREQLRQVDQNLREQLRTIRRRLDEQLRTIDIRYQEQVRRAQIAAERSIRIETEKHQRELALKQQALAAILNAEQTGATRTLQEHGAFWQNALTLASNALNAMRAASAPPAQVAQLPSRSGSTGGGQRLPTLDTGGRITRDGLAFVHRGEMVVNPRRGQGNITFAPQINGMNRAQVKREVNVALDDFLDDLFGAA